MSELMPLREAVDTLARRTEAPDFGELERRATRRGRRRVGAVVVATASVIAGTVFAVSGLDDDRRTPAPIERPKVVVGAVPVWYDAKGLHRGDVVEQTPVEIGVLGENSDTLQGALALVRSGAVYGDPATGDVWFHPWGGDPQVVGHNSAAGPGGDPDGDTAAWFDGSELVVYDTAAGHEISRTEEAHRVAADAGGEHFPTGNGFLQVSADRVVWNDDDEGIYTRDLRTASTSVVQASSSKDPFLVDLHGEVQASSEHLRLTLRAPGRPEEHYPDLEGLGRLSSDGSHLLAVEDTDQRHGAVVVDTRTGELWRVPTNTYPWIAWSYGDIAMVDHTEGELLACDAAVRACDPLPAQRPFLLPTS